MANKFDILHKGNGDDGSDSGSGDEDCEDLMPLEVPHGEHKLQNAYWLWFSRFPRPSNGIRGNALQGYTKALRLVGRCASVEQWWSMYCHMARPADLPPHTDIHLFKHGIQPMWEDPANARGGKWVIRLRKGQAGRAWENLCMAMLGEQFMVGGEICGAVISIRFPEDMLSVWNRTASDQSTTARIRDTLRRVLNLPPTITMEYKTHGDSLRASKTLPMPLKS